MLLGIGKKGVWSEQKPEWALRWKEGKNQGESKKEVLYWDSKEVKKLGGGREGHTLNSLTIQPWLSFWYINYSWFNSNLFWALPCSHMQSWPLAVVWKFSCSKAKTMLFVKETSKYAGRHACKFHSPLFYSHRMEILFNFFNSRTLLKALHAIML